MLLVSKVTWQWWDECLVFDISPKKKFVGHNVKRSQGAKASVVGHDLYLTIVVPFECGVV
jgi:hypothetical protein